MAWWSPNSGSRSPLGSAAAPDISLSTALNVTTLWPRNSYNRFGHQVAAIAFEQARWNLLRPAGRVAKQDNGLIRRPAGLHPHPGLAGRLSTRFFHHLDPHFVTVDDATFQQSIPHQVEQGLQMFAALDHPASQGFGVEYRRRGGPALFRSGAVAGHRRICSSATLPTRWGWPCFFQSVVQACRR